MNKLSVPSKINKSKLIVESISVNIGTFPTPSPDLITVSGAIDDLETAWNDAADGGKTLKKIMHDKEIVLLKLMTDLAAYVQAVANGDEAIIHLASLDVKKPPTKTKPDFAVERGTESGTVELAVKAVRGASYFYLYSLSPAGPWVQGAKSSKSKFLLSGLTPLQTYWFKVNTFYKEADHTSEVLSLVVI